jgi:hypothetical protein
MSIAIGLLMLMDMGRYLSDPRASIAVQPLPKGQGYCRNARSPDVWAPCDESYFLPGGMVLVNPLTDDFTTFPEATVYVVPRTRGYHVEFGTLSGEQKFRPNASCAIYGSESAALQLCLSTGSYGEIYFSKIPLFQIFGTT